jgi:uncharacterized membrane protein YqhA
MKLFYKIIIIVPIIFSQIIAICFVGIGIYYFSVGLHGLIIEKIGANYVPGLRLLHALDMFLFGFVFIIFSLGFSQLFLPKSKFSNLLEEVTPEWLHVKNFTELKLILWETLLTALLLIFIEQVFKNMDFLNWQMTIIPISIFLISLSIFFIKRSEVKMKKTKDD